MLDVMSMSQFLLMMSDMICVIHYAGAVLETGFLACPDDLTNPQTTSRRRKSRGPLRQSICRRRGHAHRRRKHNARQSAGLAKRTLYELEPGNIGRDTFRRARESMDAVNERILELIEESWGRR